MTRTPTPVEDLGKLLRSAFGHTAFRPLQEEVCRAVTEGHDALLVMPTGAGKSLCFQLPGLARAGTTIVLSPLIALMEDQVAALKQRGIAAERIHSGRDRLDSRNVCQDYLEGKLDFLFVAPERLAVPGFPEMLAKRPPVLIAVDEAHCISHWGHDFRPDYRMLSERLPLLRPAPIIALTATATPLVQRDIVEQLEIPGARNFIHGFRRTNIAVEVVEAKPSARGALVQKVLRDAHRRPAIVYSPTRKEAAALGAELNQSFSAAAYHAGMPSDARDQAQRAFQDGDVEVIVATIAFGMGIDKADIRTVIHTGLPGTLEGYYQEIGRAGRDGEPARAILLYSWADRRTHEYFLDRDYPEPGVLAKLYGALTEWPQSANELRAKLDLDDEVFATALEKLWIHRGARVDPEENAVQGDPGWRAPYEAQLAHRREQIERMTSFASGRGCRMLHLVRHFGDQHDSGEGCGTCDQCAPGDSLINSYRRPEGIEIEVLAAVLGLLAERDGRTSGQLHGETAADSDLERKRFELLLDGLVRSGLVDVRGDSFEKGGRTIHFQRVWLTRRGGFVKQGDLDEVLVAEEVDAPSKRHKRAKAKAAPKPVAAGRVSLDGSESVLFEKLREWRLEEARRRRTPAFRILSDKTLAAICRARPVDEEDLLEISGIGPAKARKYGRKILDVIDREE